VVEASLIGHIKGLHEQNLQEAITNCAESCSSNICNASSGLMHLVREMYRDVTHVEAVEIPDEFFDKTFIRHLIFGTGGTST